MIEQAVLKDGLALGKLHLSRKEQQWLTRIEDAVAVFPADEETLLHEMESQYGSLYDKASYGLKSRSNCLRPTAV
jgi:hypothetical protein